MSYKKWFLFPALLLFIWPVWAQDEDEECDMETDTRAYSTNFSSDDCRFKIRFHAYEQPHTYWIMEPGWQVVLEGEEDDEEVRLEITVLNETELVDGVKTRIIEEREFIDGELYEVSRNFFAICTRTNDIYYFGEDVDFYEDGEIINHDGSWRAGVDGAQPGIIIPGTVLVGARFNQELALGQAEDRAEIMEVADKTIGEETFEDVLVFQESSPLDSPCDFSTKWYAPGIGMIRDDFLEVVEAGYLFRLPPHYPYKK